MLKECIKTSCPLCGENRWTPFLQTKGEFIITGDQRIISGRLNKVMCDSCGLVRNGRFFSDEQLRKLYRHEYIMNVTAAEEHYYYTPDGRHARSELIAQWIAPFLTSEHPKVLEIGCGQGNLISALKRLRPGMDIEGLEGSEAAVAIAKGKHLRVRQGLLPDALNEQDGDEYGNIIAITVLEHIQSLSECLYQLRKMLSQNGRLILAVPVQDQPGYDLFFAEHVWHFTLEQFRVLLEHHGYAILHTDGEHPTIHGIGLIVVSPTQGEQTPKIVLRGNLLKAKNANIIKENRDLMLRLFNDINERLSKYRDRSLVLFGGGELCTLFYCFTRLSEFHPIACIDETMAGRITKKHGIPIRDLPWLAEVEAPVLLPTLHPRYHSQVIQKVKEQNPQCHIIEWDFLIKT